MTEPRDPWAVTVVFYVQDTVNNGEMTEQEAVGYVRKRLDDLSSKLMLFNDSNDLANGTADEMLGFEIIPVAVRRPFDD